MTPENLQEQLDKIKKEMGLELPSIEELLKDPKPLIALVRHYHAQWVAELVISGTGPLAELENLKYNGEKDER